MGVDGFAVVLTVDTLIWTISKETPFEYDTSNGEAPALYKIDDMHYLCAYEGVGGDGFVNILKVDTGNWTITEEYDLEFDLSMGQFPALAQIDQTHYLCVYTGPGDDGFATVLTVNTGTWTITNQIPFEYDILTGLTPALLKIDDTHYLCAYQGGATTGWAVVLTVDTGNWNITKETAFQFDNVKGEYPALSQIDNTNFLCAYSGPGDQAVSVILTVDTGNWSISKAMPFIFDDLRGNTPALYQIDGSHYLCSYAGLGDDGFVGVLELSEEIRP